LGICCNDGKNGGAVLGFIYFYKHYRHSLALKSAKLHHAKSAK